MGTAISDNMAFMVGRDYAILRKTLVKPRTKL